MFHYITVRNVTTGGGMIDLLGMQEHQISMLPMMTTQHHVIHEKCDIFVFPVNNSTCHKRYKNVK